MNLDNLVIKQENEFSLHSENSPNTDITNTEHKMKIPKVEVKLEKLDKNDNSINSELLNTLLDIKPEKSTLIPQISPVYSPSSTTLESVPNAGPSKKVKPHANGSMPKSGKPMLSDLNKRMKQQPKGRSRGKPTKPAVAVYQSQVGV